jgi:peptide deformylase
MSSLTIRKYGDPVLREKCQPVTEVTDDIRRLIDNMAETMYEVRGRVGLSAPQVGAKERVAVVDAGNGLIAIINPEIVSREGKDTGQEGCLSVPGVYVNVKRATKIVVEGLDRDGRHTTLTLDGLAARAMQQEIDHLNGILIIDYLSLAKRQLIKRKLSAIRSTN